MEKSDFRVFSCLRPKNAKRNEEYLKQAAASILATFDDKLIRTQKRAVHNYMTSTPSTMQYSRLVAYNHNNTLDYSKMIQSIFKYTNYVSINDIIRQTIPHSNIPYQTVGLFTQNIKNVFFKKCCW